MLTFFFFQRNEKKRKKSTSDRANSNLFTRLVFSFNNPSLGFFFFYYSVLFFCQSLCLSFLFGLYCFLFCFSLLIIGLTPICDPYKLLESDNSLGSRSHNKCDGQKYLDIRVGLIFSRILFKIKIFKFINFIRLFYLRV